MVGQRLGIAILAAAASLAAGAAHGADYSQPQPPQQVIIQQPPPQEFASGWYLRGFVGVGMNANYTLDYLPNVANIGNGFVLQHNAIGDTAFVGVGVGYEWNNWLRFDVTGEYRSKTRVYAFGTYPPNNLDTYEGYLKSWVFLGNAYVDLGTWYCLTPFIGAGIGTAYVKLADFTDINPTTGGYGFGRNPTKWNLAWALHAGVDYSVSKNLKIELAYRYLNYGSITDTIDCAGGCNPDSYKFDKLYSHDFMLGLRWTCCETAPAAPPQIVYTPPLRSKG